MWRECVCAIIIPCYNEEVTIVKVIEDFQSVLPTADIHVFDNNSTDNTYTLAKEKGVFVHKSPYQGKGNVIRHAFAVIDADQYIMVDGDDTYDVSVIVEGLKKHHEENLDMLSFVRQSEEKESYRMGHVFGNKMLTTLLNIFFKNNYKDILSGYRIFSKAFVKSFPAHSNYFEIETELSIYACQMRFLWGEMDVLYRARPEGSFSKLNTIKDGILILKTIIYLLSSEKPLLFFGLISSVLTLIGGGLVLDIYFEFLRISAVPRFPTFILAIFLLLTSLVCLILGITLFNIQRNTIEARRYQYNQFKSNR